MIKKPESIHELLLTITGIYCITVKKSDLIFPMTTMQVKLIDPFERLRRNVQLGLKLANEEFKKTGDEVPADCKPKLLDEIPRAPKGDYGGPGD